MPAHTYYAHKHASHGVLRSLPPPALLPPQVPDSFSVERTYILFRTMGLRHLIVVDQVCVHLGVGACTAHRLIVVDQVYNNSTSTAHQHTSTVHQQYINSTGRSYNSRPCASIGGQNYTMYSYMR